MMPPLWGCRPSPQGGGQFSDQSAGGGHCFLLRTRLLHDIDQATADDYAVGMFADRAGLLCSRDPETGGHRHRRTRTNPTQLPRQVSRQLGAGAGYPGNRYIVNEPLGLFQNQGPALRRRVRCQQRNLRQPMPGQRRANLLVLFRRQVDHQPSVHPALGGVGGQTLHPVLKNQVVIAEKDKWCAREVHPQISDQIHDLR